MWSRNYEVWSRNYEEWNRNCEVWSMNYELELLSVNLNYERWIFVKHELRIMNYKRSILKYEVTKSLSYKFDYCGNVYRQTYVLLPSWHATLNQRHINADATSWYCIDTYATLYKWWVCLKYRVFFFFFFFRKSYNRCDNQLSCSVRTSQQYLGTNCNSDMECWRNTYISATW